MRSFVIESGVPMPYKRRKSRFGSIRFSEMIVGQSVLLETCMTAGKREEEQCMRKYRAIYSSIYKLLRSIRPEGKFRVGTVEKGSKTEIRLWRVE